MRWSLKIPLASEDEEEDSGDSEDEDRRRSEEDEEVETDTISDSQVRWMKRLSSNVTNAGL